MCRNRPSRLGGARSALALRATLGNRRCAGQFYFCRNWVTEVSGDAKCAPKVRKSLTRAPLVGNTEIVLPVRDLQSRRSKDGLQCFRRSKGSWGDSATPASATRLSAAPRWERLRDHGHGRRPSPTQTAPRGGRSRDYLVGGGRSASHVPYPDLAGRHRGQAAIGATGVTGAALNSLFYRSRVQPGAVTAHCGGVLAGVCIEPRQQAAAPAA